MRRSRWERAGWGHGQKDIICMRAGEGGQEQEAGNKACWLGERKGRRDVKAGEVEGKEIEGREIKEGRWGV